MNRFVVPKASLLPAFVLAVIVGVTFATLRNYGPESTVRKAHSLVKAIYDTQQATGKVPTKTWNEVRELMIQDPGDPLIANTGDPAARRVIQGLYEEFRQGARYSLAKMDRYNREVRLAVLYSHADGRAYPVVYVVEKVPGSREWKLNANKTIQANFSF